MTLAHIVAIIFIFLILNAIFCAGTSLIYSIFGEDGGDAILVIPLIIGAIWIFSLFIYQTRGREDEKSKHK